MPTNYVSYNVVLDRLKAFADGHSMINYFSHGLLSLRDLPKELEYPCMHVVPGEINVGQGTRTFTFDIEFFDLPRTKEHEPEYQREVISDCARLAEDLIIEINNGRTLFGRDVLVEVDNTITSFIAEGAQVVTGVTISGIKITVPNDWNACDIPADWSVGGSSSGGSGSGSSRVLLKTNGTDNAVQSILDLVQGSNITILDLGDGRVRISASGSGGGGADWGSIGGDIEDQTDLQAALNGRVTDAELSTEVAARIAGDATNATAIINEATTRASADATLQSNINQVAADLSNETMARMAGDATNATDIAQVDSELDTHRADTSNPHSVTKAQIGLSNVDNTSDVNKPVSTAQAAAISLKEDSANKSTTDTESASTTKFPVWAAILSYFSASRIRTILGVSTLSGSNTGDQDLSGLQPLDSDLTAIAALTPSNDDIIQRKSGAWTNRSMAQLAADLGVATQAIRTTSTSLTLAGSSGDRFYQMTSGLSSATESVVQMSMEFAATFTGLRIRTTNTQSATGSMVWTLRVNGVDTALSITIAAGSGAGIFTSTGSVAVVAGDLVCWKARNNATVTSANLTQYSAIHT